MSYIPELYNKDKYPSVRIYPIQGVPNLFQTIGYTDSKDSGNGVVATEALIYHEEGSNYCVELTVEHGPLTIIEKMEKGQKSENSRTGEAIQHYIFDWCGGFGNWAQQRVTQVGIPKALIDGDYELVGREMKSFLDDAS